jgi:hypothetical protein
VILTVVKLEEDYDNMDNGDEGYNAFWILSPVFAITGVLLCCCSCLIYGIGAPAPGDEDLFEDNEQNENGDADSLEASQEVNAPSSAAVSAYGGEGSADIAALDATATPDVEAGNGEINDLD